MLARINAAKALGSRAVQLRGSTRLQSIKATDDAQRSGMLVRCVPGLEPVVWAELKRLRIRATVTSPGLLAAPRANMRQCYAANALLRGASRVLVPACEFRASSFSDMELAVKRLLRNEALPSLLIPDAALSIRVTASKAAELWHTSAVAERLSKMLGGSDAPDAVTQRLEVHVKNERVQIWVDTSGAPLHGRGWRTEAAKMPLKESVAAGLLLAAGWGATPEDGASLGGRWSALLDPFCGSGAIPIEAALLALGQPPHATSGRGFAFQAFPSFEPGTWASVAATVEEQLAAVARRRLRPLPPIVASDRDAGAVSAARANALRAGVEDLVEFQHCAISDASPPDTGAGLLLSNPPWVGLRSANAGGAKRDTRDLYARLGQVHGSRCEGWGLALLTNDQSLARQASPELRSALPKSLSLGGQRAWLMASPDVVDDEVMGGAHVRRLQQAGRGDARTVATAGSS